MESQGWRRWQLIIYERHAVDLKFNFESVSTKTRVVHNFVCLIITATEYI